MQGDYIIEEKIFKKSFIRLHTSIKCSKYKYIQHNTKAKDLKTHKAWIVVKIPSYFDIPSSTVSSGEGANDLQRFPPMKISCRTLKIGIKHP